MAENREEVIRCPWCMERDTDAELYYDKKDNEYYCWLCCYNADRETVYRDLKKFKHSRYKAYFSE